MVEEEEKRVRDGLDAWRRVEEWEKGDCGGWKEKKKWSRPRPQIKAIVLQRGRHRQERLKRCRRVFVGCSSST